jgi:hypothetical protein
MAAGLGFKTFTTGEVLTAADTNGYLMQGINVFASTAARDAAITSPQEGQFAYTKDTNSLWYYTGSAWAASGATGDIEGVTAGRGISGGGTSGTVTVTNSMATAIDAKGDLIAGTGADTFDRLAVGNNGETLVADSSTTTGLRYQGNFAAGKNKIINGDFGIWQRGTSFSNPSTGTYTADRWRCFNNTTSATITVSQQTFTPGTAPVAGYEGQYFFRVARTVTGSGTFIFNQRIEDVRTFAGQTVTFSFWAKANSAFTLGLNTYQYFGSGGSADVTANTSSLSITTSWARYSVTFAMPSISGKTVTTGTFIQTDFDMGANGVTFDVWGVQMEASNTATAFQTATGTIQGELAACQRYYYRTGAGATYSGYGNGVAKSTTIAYILINFPQTMRTIPSTTIDGTGTVSNYAVYDGTNVTAATVIVADIAQADNYSLAVTVASGLTQYRPYVLINNNTTAAFLGFSAEL